MVIFLLLELKRGSAAVLTVLRGIFTLKALVDFSGHKPHVGVFSELSVQRSELQSHRGSGLNQLWLKAKTEPDTPSLSLSNVWGV